jgi:flagellar basal body-associated protein FliL
MIGSNMNLLAIIIIVLAVAAAGAIIYAAWELSSDKSAINTADRLANRPSAPPHAAPPEAEEEPRSGRPEP